MFCCVVLRLHRGFSGVSYSALKEAIKQIHSTVYGCIGIDFMFRNFLHFLKKGIEFYPSSQPQISNDILENYLIR